MEDDRQGKIPDYSFQRLEFYLTGTDNTWVAVPVSEFENTLLNESDVLLIGTYQDGEMTNKTDRMYDRYFKVSFVFVLDPAGEEKISNVFTCDGSNCEGTP